MPYFNNRKFLVFSIGYIPSQHEKGFFINLLSNANLTDPLVSPVASPAVLSRFPSTLLITGTRDLALRWAAHTHTQLVKAGLQADLHVWEGMGHNFIVDMDTPEAKKAYDVIVKFIDKHLGRTFR